MSLLPRGAARGLLNYQDKIDKQKAELQKVLERRMEKLMTLGITRDGAMAKLPTYSKALKQIKYEIEGATGAEELLKGLAAMPSAAPEILKYWKKRAENQSGIELSAQDKVNSITPLEINQIEQSGGETTANIMSSIDTEQLADLDYYGSFVRRLSNVPTGRKGEFIYKTAPVKTFDSRIFGEQVKFLDRGLNTELVTAKREGLKDDTGNFRLQKIGEKANGQPITRPLNPAAITDIEAQVKNKVANLQDFVDTKGNYLFGLNTVTRALNSPEAIFTNVLQTNPLFREIVDKQLNPAVKRAILVAYGNGDTARLQEFDQQFGRGITAYIIGTR